MNHHTQRSEGYTLRELLLTVGVMAVVIRLSLSALPNPAPVEKAELEQAPRHEATQQPMPQPAAENDVEAVESLASSSSIVEVMPFSLHGDVPTPLLASILRQHRPELTDQHAGDLMNTLPPGASHRMIVILPDETAADTF